MGAHTWCSCRCLPGAEVSAPPTHWPRCLAVLRAPGSRAALRQTSSPQTLASAQWRCDSAQRVAEQGTDRVRAQDSAALRRTSSPQSQQPQRVAWTVAERSDSLAAHREWQSRGQGSTVVYKVADCMVPRVGWVGAHVHGSWVLWWPCALPRMTCVLWAA